MKFQGVNQGPQAAARFLGCVCVCGCFGVGGVFGGLLVVGGRVCLGLGGFFFFGFGGVVFCWFCEVGWGCGLGCGGWWGLVVFVVVLGLWLVRCRGKVFFHPTVKYAGDPAWRADGGCQPAFESCKP